MRGKFISSFRPTPATVIAILALVIAMTGGAIAATSNKGPVTVFTTTGGPFTQVGEGGTGEDRIIVALASPNSFTQKTGQVALIAAELDTTGSFPDPNTEGGGFTCDLIVQVNVHYAGLDQFGVGVLSVMDLANRGGVRAGRTDSGALAAPASSRVVTLDAQVFVEGPPGPDGAPTECANDSYTFTIRVSVATMPS